MARCIFITGTDTEVGKTYVTQHLLKAFNRHLNANGFKPVAADATRSENGLRNDDALALMQESVSKLDYQTFNPYCFEPPIAPHIAAKAQAVQIEPKVFDEHLSALENNADIVLIEGAGGWLLPLSNNYLMSDWVQERGFEVLLVVGIKLGCLNHSLLTMHALQAQGVKVSGWIANCLSPRDEVMTQNIEYLEQHISAPCLALLEFDSSGTLGQIDVIEQGIKDHLI